MKKIIYVLCIIVFILISPSIFQKKSIPNNLIYSTIGITTIDTSGEIYNATCFPIGNFNNTTYLATCSHIVDRELDKIFIFYEDSIYNATKVCSDQINDIAIVSVDENLDCNPLPISEVGLISRVYASGFPDNYDSIETLYNDNFKVVTTGNVISVIGSFDKSKSIICSAPCEKGMSGGPIVNGKGEVVGIITVKYSEYKNIIGAACSIDLINLCNEYNIPYTHKISLIPIRDIILLILLIVILWMIIYTFLERRIKTKNNH